MAQGLPEHERVPQLAAASEHLLCRATCRTLGSCSLPPIALSNAARTIEPALIRYPALDAATFLGKVDAMVATLAPD